MKTTDEPGNAQAKVYDLSQMIPQGRDHTWVILQGSGRKILVLTQNLPILYMEGSFYYPNKDEWTLTQDQQSAFTLDKNNHILWGEFL